MFCSRCGTWAPDDTSICPLCGLALQVDNWPKAVPLPPAPAVVPIVTYGGFWRRMFAAVLDGIVLYFPVAILRALLRVPPGELLDPLSALSWTTHSIEFVLEGLYTVLFMCSAAQGTLGMQVMDLKVTDLQGRRVSAARAVGRYFAQCLSILTLGIGFLIQPFTPRRQMLHDILAGTLVVRPRRQNTPAPVAPGAALRMVP
jgi:uncharacterized RDD family membrane protein YckC